MIETARLRLRPLTDADRAWNAAEHACPIVMEHLGGPQDRAASDLRVDKMIALQASLGFSFWVAERRADGERIGLVGLKLFDAEGATLPGAIEIGWRLARAAWGQGYAREAAEATLAFAFERLEVAQVVALTSEANAASWGLMRRLGMTRRRDLDFDDPRYPDDRTILHVITGEDWRSVQSRA